MSIEVKVPEVGESIREVQIAQWFKQPGQWVDKNENLVELDTDKATVQLAAPVAGTLASIEKAEGQIANVGEVIAVLDETAVRQPSDGSPAKASLSVGAATGGQASAPAAVTAPPVPPASPPTPAIAVPVVAPVGPPGVAATSVMPAAQRLLEQYGLPPAQVAATGPGGRLLKEDVLRHVATHAMSPAAAPPAAGEPAAPSPAVPQSVAAAAAHLAVPAVAPLPALEVPRTAELAGLDRQEEIVPMTMIRRRIAQRLVEAQQNAALLTTFNEADMSAVMELRKRHRESFQERYGVKLGFMSFFVKASIEALKRFPQVNAEVRGDNIVYRNYYDIGIAVGGGRGLVVPVLRNAERMSFAEVETTIEELGRRARDNQLKPEELLGGTFTISNGGIYGSLLSTPIVNPPQSGILGLHAIQDRPVARDGQVVIRPMMYLALTYDHRIVDGREAVGFLRSIKEIIEEPARLVLEV